MTLYKIRVSAEGVEKAFDVTAPSMRHAFLTAAADPQDPEDILSKAIRDDRFARQVPPSTGSVVCPSCSGFGEFQESYTVKGMNARIIDCPDCHGRRFVASESATVLQRRGKPAMPDGWSS